MKGNKLREQAMLLLQWLIYLYQGKLITTGSKALADRVGCSPRTVDRCLRYLAREKLIARAKVKLKVRPTGRWAGKKFKRRRMRVRSQEPLDVLAKQASRVLADFKPGWDFRMSYLAIRLRCDLDQAAAAVERARRDGLLDFDFDASKGTFTMKRVNPVTVQMPQPVLEAPPYLVTTRSARIEAYVDLIRRSFGRVPRHADAAARLRLSLATIERIVRVLKDAGVLKVERGGLVFDPGVAIPGSPFGIASASVPSVQVDDDEADWLRDRIEADEDQIEPVVPPPSEEDELLSAFGVPVAAQGGDEIEPDLPSYLQQQVEDEDDVDQPDWYAQSETLFMVKNPTVAPDDSHLALEERFGSVPYFPPLHDWFRPLVGHGAQDDSDEESPDDPDVLDALLVEEAAAHQGEDAEGQQDGSLVSEAEEEQQGECCNHMDFLASFEREPLKFPYPGRRPT